MRFNVTSVCGSCLLAIATLSSHGLGAADVWFRLEASVAAPGNTVRVPFTIESDAEVRAFATVVNFDESLLQVTDIETVHVVPDIYNRNPTYPTEYEASVNWAFHAVHYGNTDAEPGDGTNEGVIKAAGLWSFTEYVALPTGRPNEIFSFNFRVNDDAEEGTTEIRFEDYLVLPGTSSNARNVVTISNIDVLFPTLDTYPLVINGFLSIVGDVSMFRRGDANGDAELDISDPVATLGYLFAGDSSLPCLDAADSNDDGALDISDAAATLNFLFQGSAALPAPSGDPGVDPTPDALGCEGNAA